MITSVCYKVNKIVTAELLYFADFYYREILTRHSDLLPVTSDSGEVSVSAYDSLLSPSWPFVR